MGQSSPDRLTRIFQFAEQPVRPGMEGRTLLRQSQRLPAALDQAHAQALLQFPDVSRQRRFRLPGGAARVTEPAVSGHGVERSESG